MSQLEFYISKRHTCACASGCACSAIIFWGLRKRLRRNIFRVVARALAAQLLWLALPTYGGGWSLVLLFWSSLDVGDKNFSNFGNDPFFLGLYFIFSKACCTFVIFYSREENSGRASSPQCLKKGKIGVKLQIVPPMLIINRHHWLLLLYNNYK